MRVLDVTAPVSVADQERKQLELALRASAMAGPLAAALHRAGLAPANSRPACHILDVKYVPGETCQILYALGERLVLAALAFGTARERTGETGDWIAPPGMPIFFFPADPAMPGLVTALRPEEMAAALTSLLPGGREGKTRLTRCRVTPLRYRPGRRCTLRLELWALHTGIGVMSSRTLFGKVYHSQEKALSVFEQMQMLSDVASPRSGRLVVARVAGFLPDLPMVVQEPLAGVPLDLFLDGRTRVDPRGQSGVVMAASALADLHGLDVRHPRLRSVGDELRRMAHRSRSAATVDPELGARMADLATALSRRLEQLSLESREQRMVHADCKPSQFLIDGTKVGLLDFDHAGMADPALDVGTFMASLTQLGWRPSPKACRSTRSNTDGSMRGLERSFLDSYCQSADVDADFRQRAVWYQAFALLRKAQRAFARSFRSRVPERLVDEARRCLLSAEAEGSS